MKVFKNSIRNKFSDSTNRTNFYFFRYYEIPDLTQPFLVPIAAKCNCSSKSNVAGWVGKPWVKLAVKAKAFFVSIFRTSFYFRKNKENNHV